MFYGRPILCKVKIRVQEENCFAIEKNYNLNIVIRNIIFIYVKFKILLSINSYIRNSLHILVYDLCTAKFL